MSEKNVHARFEAFCDAVFAIAITLLVLEIKIPHIDSVHSVPEFWHHLAADWPSWFGFILSFIIILVSWINHHNIFKLINKSSPQFIYANGFMLFTIAVFPFTTGLMSEYLRTDFAQPAATVYCASILLHNISWNFFAWTAMRPVCLFKDDASRDMFAKKVHKPIKFAFLFYLSLCILSFWLPLAAMVIMTFSWLYWVFIAIIVDPNPRQQVSIQ